ncbi:HAAS signaling domain-containing protein [Oceanobacillus sp. CF4.6]|uniref:HAAS signaling domain-containing protein n=1 Tax=Oceanobacillus sp. CF4.6 TaxID=3373080 RepID=UPI003EE6074A
MASLCPGDEQLNWEKRVMTVEEEDLFQDIATQRFLNELDKEIGDHPDKQSIMAEYKLHVYDLLQEETLDGDEIYEELVNRLGTPKELALLWKQETAVTPRKMQWLFVLCNLAIFLGGALLTIGYNVFDWGWLESLWTGLTDATSIIILAYTMFWGLLGYEIGKAFGARGYKLLNKTFIFSIVPNLVFMYLIVFKLIPYEWFQPILSVRLIIVCILCTGFLYPVSWLGYRWGRKASV